MVRDSITTGATPLTEQFQLANKLYAQALEDYNFATKEKKKLENRSKSYAPIWAAAILGAVTTLSGYYFLNKGETRDMVTTIGFTVNVCAVSAGFSKKRTLTLQRMLENSNYTRSRADEVFYQRRHELLNLREKINVGYGNYSKTPVSDSNIVKSSGGCVGITVE